MSAPFWLLVWIAFLAFAARRLLLYLHVFQQEEYDAPRFLRWLMAEGAVDRRTSFGIVILALLGAIPQLSRLTGWVATAIVAGLFLSAAWRERNPLKDAKKKLVMTARAKRVYAIALIYAAAIGYGFAVWIPPREWWPPLVWLVPVHLMPAMLILSVLTLMPQERFVQRRYWREAHEKIVRLAPRVIGITGSFGKTSVKQILAHVMETASTGLATPGSVNTPMGIARIVRERLRPEHRYFIAEMGAYGPGSIDRLCRLTPPDLAILTAIGKAHYERFRSLDTVASAKLELAEATVARGGKVVIPEALLDFAPVRNFAGRHPDSLVLVGTGERCALKVLGARQTAEGLSLSLLWDGTVHELTVPIHGAHQARNIALAFAAACILGVDPETAAIALRSAPQIAHRLEVRRRADGVTVLDDAYNSNPEGFAAALETLDRLARGGDGPAGRRILVTPGMVELGAAHDEEHQRLGTLAARQVDILLAVVPERIERFIAAFDAGAEGRELIRCRSFAEADAWIAENARASDVVLLENDLPDLYERKLDI